MVWLGGRGAQIYVPLFHSPDYDLIADLHDRLLRVQVKTSTCHRGNRWDVTLATRGGNQSWTGLVKYLDPSRCDYVFVLVGDGRRWFIPSEALGGGRGIRLGGPKYAAFEVDRGDPIPTRSEAEVDSRIGSPLPRGDARAAKGSRL
jgi:hypothetical protein